MYDRFAFEIWQQERGTQSEVFVEVKGAVLNTMYGVNIFPPAGHEALIPHKFTIALPLSTERGDPAGDEGRYSGSAQTYQTLASYTVPASPARFELQEIYLNSDTFAKTNFKLTIGGTQWFTDRVFIGAMTLRFRKNYLAAGEQVLLEVESTDGTAIVANSLITGREYYPYEWQIWVFKKGLISEEHTAYLSDDLIKDGIGSWVYVTKGQPLRVEVKKLYGRANDHILIYAWSTKVQSLKDLENIQELAKIRGVRERLPFEGGGAAK